MVFKIAKRTRKESFDSNNYCTKCGNKGIPIARKKGAEREAGHLKKLFCLHCNQERNHVECKPFSHYDYEDFKLEMSYGNFDENGLRKMTYGELKTAINNGEIERNDVNE